jgi:hypothetical protein
MRLNVDLPDWLYLQFKKKFGKGNLSSTIKSYILSTCGSESTNDLFELKRNLEVLKSKVVEAEQQTDLIWIQYQEAQQTRDSLKQDILALDTFIKEKETKMERDIQEQEKIENEIKLNTLKDRMSDGDF